jgi:hypothetical protein
MGAVMTLFVCEVSAWQLFSPNSITDVPLQLGAIPALRTEQRVGARRENARIFANVLGEEDSRVVRGAAGGTSHIALPQQQVSIQKVNNKI